MNRSCRRSITLALLLVLAGMPGETTAAEVDSPGDPSAAESPAITFKRLPGTRPQSAALLASANEGGVLPMRLVALRENDPAGALEITLEVPSEALFAGVEAARATLEITLYATNAGGEVVAAQSTALGIARPRLARLPGLPGPAIAAGESALRIFDRLAVPQGAVALRALLYCRESGAFTLRRVALPVAGAEPVASGTAIAGATAATGNWIDVPLSAPRVAGRPATPSTTVTTAITATTAPPAPAPSSALSAPPADGAARAEPPRALDREAGPLPAHDDLPQVAELEAALRGVYRSAAGGDRDGAVQQLIRIERTVGAADPKRGLVRLDRATSRVTGAVARTDPGLLVVLALLHQQTGFAERQHRQTGLAQRNEELAMLLLERMAKDSPRKTDRGLAAAALAGLALPYLERAAPRAGVLLERSLVVGGDEPPRLIALAAVRAHEGDTRAARTLLDRALAVAPGNREAALRRAIADAAEGADERAERELRRLCEGRESDWIALLACQERARKALGRRQYEAASQILARARAQWPDDPTLIVALAFTQRNLGQRTAAAELSLRALALAPTVSTAATSGAAYSPRQRYVLGPRAYLLTQRYAAEQAAAFRAPPLLAALGGTAAGRAKSR